MSLFTLPMILQESIFDNYVDILSYWKKQFTCLVLPLIVAKQKHMAHYKKVMFEFLAYWGKRELEKYSVNGIIFSYKKQPIKQSFESSTLWYILFEGIKSKNKKITLLFENRFNYNDNFSSIIVEASGVFPFIKCNDFGGYEDLGREEITNFQHFINKFMNAIFSA